ncbi:hypothetical protein ASM33_06485 [Wolbachia endosymbiont of Folsomia candida]|nr:hypothetical protein ASM33_00080 [Wolbachia endosymbiont of Folsomia candida]APR98771.2 hypothetical protein ASM33_06065 [Wolbachia endosymbiont of Folsomia candida]APR98841.2 hypothetical protein ASM33_06485 [Wolbachia endosymbiont of Folsomia candida]
MLNKKQRLKMPKPYSEDLRERVLKVVDEKKMSMKAVSEMFSIDRKTLYWWRKRREETGSVKPAYGYQTGHRSKIKDMGSFFKFLEDNQDVTTDKVIEKFGNMCKETAYNYLKKAGYTYKKNLSLSRER